VILTETYPAGVTFLDANPAPTSGDNIWDLGTLAVGESGVIYINVTIDLTVTDGTLLSNYIRADWDDGRTWTGWGDASADTLVIVPVPEFGPGPLFGILAMLGIFIFTRRWLRVRDK
jgi:hypothetical protein